MDSETIYQTMLEKCPPDSKNIHYLKRYVKFIFACIDKNRDLDEGTYIERHHILPKSMWPDYKDFRYYEWNCSVLTARQHFIAHWILARALGDKMWHAFQLMCFCKSKDQNRIYKISSNCYSDLKNNYSISEEAKRKISIANKGRIMSKETKQKLSDINKGKKHSQKTKLKMGLKSKGRKLSEEAKRKMSEAKKGTNNHMFGKKQTDESNRKRSCSMKGKNTGPKSEEAKRKMSEAKKNQPTIKCPNCGKLGKGAMMKRWHFDNCKW